MRLNYRHFFAHYAICISIRCARLSRRRERHTAGRWARGRRHYDYARARRQIRRIEKNFLGKNRTSICFHEDIRKPRVTRACPGPIEHTRFFADGKPCDRKMPEDDPTVGSIVLATRDIHARISLYNGKNRAEKSGKRLEKKYLKSACETR